MGANTVAFICRVIHYCLNQNSSCVATATKFKRMRNSCKSMGIKCLIAAISASNFTVIVSWSKLGRIICIKCLCTFMASTSLLKTLNAFPPLCLLSDSWRDAFSLLCADGTQAPLSHYRSCNLGRGPGGATVTRFNFRKVSQKFLLTVQVLLCHSSLTDSVSIPIIVLSKCCPMLLRCSLAKKDRRCSASSSSIHLFLERRTSCSEMRRTN